MELINEKDGALMSICVETPGYSEMDPYSGEPTGNCFFAMLIQEGCASASLDSAGGRDVPSLEYLNRLVSPERGHRPINKMQLDFLN